MVKNNEVGAVEAGFNLSSEPIVPIKSENSQLGINQINPKNLTIDQAITLASKHQREGNFQKAQNILNQVLKAAPKNSKALHTIGIITHETGNTKLAVEYIEEAIKNNGNIAIYHANIAEMYRLLKDVEKAIFHGKKAAEIDPNLVSAHSNLGIAYFDNKQFDMAEECQTIALKLNPNFSSALNNMGSICREKKDDKKAAEYYKRAIKANPNSLEPRNNLAVTLTRLDKPEEALQILDYVLLHNPYYAEAQCNKGFALVSLERDKEALTYFDKSLHIKPDYAEAYLGIARAYNNMYELDAAELAVLKAIEINPELAEAYSFAGVVYLSQGYANKAQEAFEIALKFDPELNSAKQGLGNIHLEEGRFKEAEELFRSTLNSGAERLGALFSLTQTKKVKPEDDIIKLVEEEAKKIENLSESKAVYVHFALGKIYDDIGDHDKSFEHFIEGCRLKRKKIIYDPSKSEKTVTRTIEIFNEEFIKKNTGYGDKSDAPIFVCGMPRSGTTLTEQIVASHPDVHGAGEIFDLLDIMNWRGKSGNLTFPENAINLTPEKINEIGKQYVAGVQLRNEKALKITDKMPANFYHIGLIHLAMPNAKIIHVNRNPLDTCISCFTRLFSHNQNSTYNLTELGNYYKQYSRLIEHWRKVLPKNSFYDICYEDLVADTENEAKKLIEYCGLNWDDSCLEFHKNKRNIRTASVTQVRQPIYSSSVARWKKYEKFLGPLIEGLGSSFATK